MHGNGDELGECDGVDDAENSDRGRILGTTTVSRGDRITLIVGVRESFSDRGVEVEEGDTIVYRLSDDRVVVEPA
jgi:hypothetical protein